MIVSTSVAIASSGQWHVYLWLVVFPSSLRLPTFDLWLVARSFFATCDFRLLTYDL
jgi:hypothetical protein